MRRSPRSVVTSVAVVALVGALATGCGGDEPPAETPDAGSTPDADDGTTAPSDDGTDADGRFDDGRLSFAVPDGWEVVERGEADEWQVRLEPVGGGAEGDGPPDGTIVALWPFVANWELDAAVTRWGADEDDPLVGDVETDEVEVPGASEAVRQDYTVADVSPGEGEEPASYRTVIAMGEVGRTVLVMVAAPDASDVDVDAVADEVLGSLELAPEWSP